MAEEKAAFTYGAEFQNSILAMMLKDLAFCEKAVSYVPEEKLFSEAHQFLFSQIKKKFLSSGDVPTLVEIEDEVKYIDMGRRKLYLSFTKEIFKLEIRDHEFIKDRLTEYARKNSFIKIFQEGQTLWNTKRHEDAYSVMLEGINDLYSISFKDDISISSADFETIRQRYCLKTSMTKSRISTNIYELDKILSGGLEKGEFGILLGEAKKGKSIGLIHMGSAALLSGFGRVLHFVLEGQTEQTTMRYQSRFSGIEYNRIRSDELTNEERERLKSIDKRYKDRLDVVPFNQHWHYTVLDVEARIREHERRGMKPDLVVLDYADLLKSHEKTKEHRFEQMWVYRALKQMAMLHDVALWTASQATKPPEDESKRKLLRARDIAESYEKVRIADLILTVNQTVREKQIGVLRLHVDMYRSNETDLTLVNVVDFRRMIFYNPIYGSIFHIPEWFLKRRGRKKGK